MLKILDCTMRDGGYYNDWDFSPEFAREYLQLMSELEVDFVEVGFRFLRSSSHLGAWAYSPDSAIKNVLPDRFDFKLGVMLNLSEYLGNEDEIAQVFGASPAIDFVRLAAHFEELPQAANIAKKLRGLGLMVGLNLMQISERSEKEIREFARIATDMQVDFAYFADSLGSLSEIEAAKICRQILTQADITVGIHAHDNRGLATSNTMAAIAAGASMVDCTLMGMGRGAGNSATEDLLTELSYSGMRNLSDRAMRSLATFLDKNMAPLKQRYGWGKDLDYKLAALWGVHPTYVQELQKEMPSPGEVTAILQQLRAVGAAKFDSSLVSHVRNGAADNDKNVDLALTPYLAECRASTFLIVGSGPSLQTYRSEIERKVESLGMTVILLNDAELKCGEATHGFRLAASGRKLTQMGSAFWDSDLEYILPNLKAPESAKARTSVIPRLIQPGRLLSEHNKVITPNSLSFSYAVASALFLGATDIFLAGIDGYEGDTRNADLNESVQLASAAISLVSLTPTRLSVPWVSPFWRSSKA